MPAAGGGGAKNREVDGRREPAPFRAGDRRVTWSDDSSTSPAALRARQGRKHQAHAARPRDSQSGTAPPAPALHASYCALGWEPADDASALAAPFPPWLSRPAVGAARLVRPRLRAYGLRLGERGAAVLASEGGRGAALRWDKSRNVSRQFLRHTLAVAEVMVAFEVACRNTQGVEFIRPEEIFAGVPDLAQHGRTLLSPSDREATLPRRVP